MAHQNYLLYKNKDGKNNAGNKFVDDLLRICAFLEFRYIAYGRENAGLFSKIKGITKFFKCIAKIPSNSNVFIIYPTMPKYYKILLIMSRIKKYNLIGIIMDLPSLNQKNINIDDDVLLLKKLDGIIFQNKKQKDLFSLRIKRSIYSNYIGILDYIGTPSSQVYDGVGGGYTICYGGSLSPTASAFLYKWINDNNLITTSVNIYGIEWDKVRLTSNFHYNGYSTSKDILNKLKGDFGLIWSGDETNVCAGSKGKYYEYATPHKLSMYIMAGMPIIVPNNFSIKKEILDLNIGLVINSLGEIEEKLNKISKEEYLNMQKNVIEVQKEISKGLHTLRCIKEMVEHFDRRY